jgi:hypothetical protein
MSVGPQAAQKALDNLQKTHISELRALKNRTSAFKLCTRVFPSVIYDCRRDVCVLRDALSHSSRVGNHWLCNLLRLQLLRVCSWSALCCAISCHCPRVRPFPPCDGRGCFDRQGSFLLQSRDCWHRCASVGFDVLSSTVTWATALKQLSDSTGTFAQLKAIDPLYLPAGFRQAITLAMATHTFTLERVHASSKAAAAVVTFMLGLLRYAEVRSFASRGCALRACVCVCSCQLASQTVSEIESTNVTGDSLVLPAGQVAERLQPLRDALRIAEASETGTAGLIIAIDRSLEGLTRADTTDLASLQNPPPCITAAMSMLVLLFPSLAPRSTVRPRSASPAHSRRSPSPGPVRPATAAAGSSSESAAAGSSSFTFEAFAQKLSGFNLLVAVQNFDRDQVPVAFRASYAHTNFMPEVRPHQC